MFGYVIANPAQLNEEQKTLYRSYYCGLCRSLKQQFGQVSRLTLNYDMTFMVLFLADLLDPQTKTFRARCAIHPVKRKMISQNEIIDYGAAMNVLLAYYNLLDNWKDDRDTASRVGAAALKKHIPAIRSRYPRQTKAVEEGMKALGQEEAIGPRELDTAANIFGDLLGELFVFQNDRWAEDCRNLGRALGNFIYWLDAYCDLKKDRKKNRYNPLILIGEEPDFEVRVREMLEGALGDCALILERLPLVEHLEILRNVLYSGVWTKYNTENKGDQI